MKASKLLLRICPKRRLYQHHFDSNIKHYSRTPIIRTLVIRIANYTDWLGSSRKFVENSKTKLTCLEITGYRIKYSTVSWLLELQIRRSLKV